MCYAGGNGTVTFKDGLVLYYEYNGTYDVCIPTLYNTFEEMNKNSKNHMLNTCNCVNEQEEVNIWTAFWDGMNWSGKACRNCMCITEGLEPDEKDYPFNANEYLSKICLSKQNEK